MVNIQTGAVITGACNSSSRAITSMSMKTRSVTARHVRKKDERRERRRRCEKTMIVVVLPIRPVNAIVI